MLNRRQLLTKGAIIAGGACLPQSFWADDKPQCNPFCHGPTCAALGMVGQWPNCYYPQYANLNVSLVNATAAAKLGMAQAVLNRGITQAQWNNMLSLSQQHSAHLWNTTISEGYRKQFTQPAMGETVTQQLIQRNQQYAAQYGVDVNEVTAMTKRRCRFHPPIPPTETPLCSSK